MAARRAFLIRLDPAVLAAVESWAGDELRSVNAQIEFLLRESLRRAGRTAKKTDPENAEPASDDE